jgi:hypothetical protein
MKRFISIPLTLIFVVTVFVYGMGIWKYQWFPHDIVKQLKYLTLNNSAVEFDEFGRLVYSSAHHEVECPHQTERTGVLISFGQSNSANHAEYKFKEGELNNVVNYYNGRCFQAQSPLLGATGAGGEWIALTASKLVKKGLYDNVVVLSSGIGGTPISRWAKNNDLNRMFIDVLIEISAAYKVTEMIWHQGESDRKYTHFEVYQLYFKSMLKTIREAKVEAPLFVSIASICGEESKWDYPNSVSLAQLEVTQLEGVQLGANTDENVPISMRYDGCHFSKLAQEVAATEMAEKIIAYRMN